MVPIEILYYKRYNQRLIPEIHKAGENRLLQAIL